MTLRLLSAPRRYVREIGLLLALKVLALIALYCFFFSVRPAIPPITDYLFTQSQTKGASQ